METSYDFMLSFFTVLAETVKADDREATGKVRLFV